MIRWWRQSPALMSLAALVGLLLVAVTLAVPAGAAVSSFTAVSVLNNDFITDPTGQNTSLKHNLPNLRIIIDGQILDAPFKDHYADTGGLDRWGLSTSEVFEEETGALTQYYQRGAVDFHKRNDLGGIWVLERRLTWDYMGGGLGGSVDQGYEDGIYNPNTGLEFEEGWGHKVSNVDITGKFNGFRDFFDRLGGVDSFGLPKTDAREDTGAPGTLLTPGATPGITRQYFPGGRFRELAGRGARLSGQTHSPGRLPPQPDLSEQPVGLVSAVPGGRSPASRTELYGSKSRPHAGCHANSSPHQYIHRSHHHSPPPLPPPPPSPPSTPARS